MSESNEPSFRERLSRILSAFGFDSSRLEYESEIDGLLTSKNIRIAIGENFDGTESVVVWITDETAKIITREFENLLETLYELEDEMIKEKRTVWNQIVLFILRIFNLIGLEPRRVRVFGTYALEVYTSPLAQFLIMMRYAPIHYYTSISFSMRLRNIATNYGFYDYEPNISIKIEKTKNEMNPYVYMDIYESKIEIAIRTKRYALTITFEAGFYDRSEYEIDDIE